MPYIIETWDHPNSLSLRALHRQTHLEFLAQNAKLLLACGAKLTDDGVDIGGGLYVVALEDKDEARLFIEADPFFAAGLFQKIAITRWRKAYIDGTCYLT